jgi:predicted metal-dependent hydrolase
VDSYNSTISYGKHVIAFRVLFVSRKTLEISVHPDNSVVVKAPLGTPDEEVRKRVGIRARWIKRQQDHFRQFEPRTPHRQYVGGETHLYLGKRYRLKILEGQGHEVKLVRGFFLVTVIGDITSERIKAILKGWYIQKARTKFTEAFEQQWSYFQKIISTKPRIQIRVMRKRWGNLANKGLLTLNTDLIRAPRECIDYVITHELCHLKYPDHNAGFYKMLEKVMPDWEKRKHKLELALV